MFVGQGMGRRGQGGLGLYQPTPTGIKVAAVPTCAFPAEKAEAASKCQTYNLRGLGADRILGPMTGRLAGYSPCDVQNYPVCPTPKCIDDQTVSMILKCVNGMSVEGVNCKDPATALYLYSLSLLPYCGTPTFLGPVPSCLSKEQQGLVAYCNAHPDFRGPDQTSNNLCWINMHDAAFWSKYRSAPPCAAPPPPAPPPVRPPPALKPPPAPPPPAPPPVKPPPSAPPPTTAPPSDFAPPEDIPQEPDHRESSMMGLWGILALVAVGGGGYYLYRRYKK